MAQVALLAPAARLVPAGVFLAAFLLYVPSFDALFAVLDFNHLDAIRSTDAATYFLRIFDPSDGGRTVFATGDLYRPIYYTVFWFEYQAFGADPLPYYVFNATIHGANAVLVYLLAKRLTNSNIASVAGAMIWAFHPQYADAVVWVSSTADLLLVFFGLSAVLLYAKALDLDGRARIAMTGLSFGAALLALGAKESGIMIVPIIAGYHVLLGDPKFLRERRIPWGLLPFLVLPLVYFPMRLALVGNLAANGDNDILSGEVFVNIHILASLAAAPLVGETSQISVLSVEQGAAGIGVIAAVVAAAVFGSRREWFLAGWFLLAITPVLVFPQVWLVGRYLYLPLVGLAILGGMGIARAVELVSLLRLEVARLGTAAALIVGVMLWLGALNIDHQNWWTAKGEEAGAFIASLKSTYSDLPEDGRLIVTQHPRSLSFTPNDGMMLASAVRLAYDKDLEVITPWHLNRGEAAPTERDLWYPP